MRGLASLLLVASLAGCAGMGERRAELADINYRLGVGYFQQGDYATAVDKLRRAERLQPERVDVLMVLGLSQQALGHFDRAEAAYRRALEVLEGEEVDPAALALAGEVHNNYGVLLCAQGRVEEAEAHFRAALREPDYRTPAAAWENLGLCALRAGRERQAEAALRQALALEPERRPSLTALARLAWERGDAPAARRYLRRARLHDRLSPAELALAVDVERALGDEAAARALENELLQYYPDSPQAARVKPSEKDITP